MTTTKSVFLLALSMVLFIPAASGSDEIDLIRRQLRDDYGIRLVVATKDYRFEFNDDHVLTGQTISRRDLLGILPIALQALQDLPASFVRQLNIKILFFGSHVRHNEVLSGGLADPSRRAMFFNASLYKNRYAEFYRPFMHELYHFADIQDDGLLENDPAWAALNPANAGYHGGGYKFLKESGIDLIRIPKSGYLSTGHTDLDKSALGMMSIYSTASAAEDKAEIFAHLLADHNGAMTRANTDGIIAEKIDFMKRKLHQYNSDFNDEYWDRIRLKPML